jgi:hypothetical protein
LLVFWAKIYHSLIVKVLSVIPSYLVLVLLLVVIVIHLICKMIFLCPLVSILFFSGLAFGQVQLLNVSQTQTGWDYTCVGVLNQQVVCDPSLAWAGNGRFEDSSTLTAVCTSTCTASLATWLRRANGACTTQVTAFDGSTFLPSIYVESIVENYNMLCLQNK